MLLRMERLDEELKLKEAIQISVDGFKELKHFDLNSVLAHLKVICDSGDTVAEIIYNTVTSIPFDRSNFRGSFCNTIDKCGLSEPNPYILFGLVVYIHKLYRYVNFQFIPENDEDKDTMIDVVREFEGTTNKCFTMQYPDCMFADENILNELEEKKILKWGNYFIIKMAKTDKFYEKLYLVIPQHFMRYGHVNVTINKNKENLMYSIIGKNGRYIKETASIINNYNKEVFNVDTNIMLHLKIQENK